MLFRSNHLGPVARSSLYAWHTASRQALQTDSIPARPEPRTRQAGRGNRKTATTTGNRKGARVAGTLQCRSGQAIPGRPVRSLQQIRVQSRSLEKYRIGSAVPNRVHDATGSGEAPGIGSGTPGFVLGGTLPLRRVEPEQTPHVPWQLSGLASAGFRPEPCARPPAGAFFH